MVALPTPTDDTVTVPLLIAAVAAFPLLLLTLKPPLPLVLALNVPVVLAALVPLYVNVPFDAGNVPAVKLTLQLPRPTVAAYVALLLV